MSRWVVVDTNVVVAGVLTRDPGAPTAWVLDGMLRGEVRFLLSVALLAEYREVLLRPRIRSRHKLSVGEIDALLTHIAENGVLREVTSGRSAPDIDDDHLWALLATAPRAVLVTGDGLLLANPPDGASVILTRTFLDTGALY